MLDNELLIGFPAFHLTNQALAQESNYLLSHMVGCVFSKTCFTDGSANADGERIDQTVHYSTNIVSMRTWVRDVQRLQLSIIQLQVSNESFLLTPTIGGYQLKTLGELLFLYSPKPHLNLTLSQRCLTTQYLYDLAIIFRGPSPPSRLPRISANDLNRLSLFFI